MTTPALDETQWRVKQESAGLKFCQYENFHEIPIPADCQKLSTVEYCRNYLVLYSAALEAIDFDGRLWYVKEDCERMKTVQMENIAKRFKEKFNLRKSKEYLMNSQREYKKVTSPYLSTAIAYDSVFVRS